MSLNFYTNVQSFGNQIFYRGVRDGKRIKLKIDYQPSFYLPSKKPTPYSSLEGIPLERKKFDDIRDARDFLKRYQDVPGAPTIYGQSRFEYAFIGEQHRGAVDFDASLVQVDFLDIEVGSENGFPNPYEANEPITAIGLKTLGGKIIVWGCGDYDNSKDETNSNIEVTYIKCKDEYSLCKQFLIYWHNNCPDIVTGWNTEWFDIPYLVNRFRRILGEEETRKLSPWNFIRERKVNVNGKMLISYTLAGISHLDYIELYKWYAPNGKSQENYRLDTIAEVEIGENKLSFDEYDNLHALYRLNHQKFIEYNIKDVVLVERIDDKLKLIELAITLAYDTKSNMEDVFAQTRMWDALTYCYLLDRGIIVPPRIVQEKNASFEGAYVKEPQTGVHNWVAAFDLNSLYPHLMMQYNISPETLVKPEDYTDEMRSVLAQDISVDKMLLKQVDTSPLAGQNVTITPNGQFFRTDIQGFLPKMLEEMYNDRKKFKKLMLTAKQELENETDNSKRYEIEKRIAKYNNIQLAKKVGLNSAYGALGSQYFRFYDLRMALGVTTAGKLSIRWIEAKINAYMNRALNTVGEDYVIASDTDSIYLRLGALVESTLAARVKDTNKAITFMDKVCELKIQPYIDKSYTELAEYVYAYKQKMEMKRESLSDRGIWTAKKRYILNVYNNEGVQYKEPDLKIMGLEMIKSSTPSVVRTKMKELVKVMISGDEKDVQQFVEQFRQDFRKLSPEDISFPRGCNGIGTYSDKLTLYTKGTPIHVRGAIIYNHHLKEKNLTKKYPMIQEGEKVKFTYLKMPNTFKDNVISFPGRLPQEFDIHQFIDYDMQFEKAFLEPIRVIVQQVGWKVEQTDSIEDFFT